MSRSHQNNEALLAPIQIRGPPLDPYFGQFESPPPLGSEGGPLIYIEASRAVLVP